MNVVFLFVFEVRESPHPYFQRMTFVSKKSEFFKEIINYSFDFKFKLLMNEKLCLLEFLVLDTSIKQQFLFFSELLLFRCVSKAWRNFIDNSTLIDYEPNTNMKLCDIMRIFLGTSKQPLLLPKFKKIITDPYSNIGFTSFFNEFYWFKYDNTTGELNSDGLLLLSKDHQFDLEAKYNASCGLWFLYRKLQLSFVAPYMSISIFHPKIGIMKLQLFINHLITRTFGEFGIEQEGFDGKVSFSTFKEWIENSRIHICIQDQHQTHIMVFKLNQFVEKGNDIDFVAKLSFDNDDEENSDSDSDETSDSGEDNPDPEIKTPSKKISVAQGFIHIPTKHKGPIHYVYDMNNGWNKDGDLSLDEYLTQSIYDFQSKQVLYCLPNGEIILIIIRLINQQGGFPSRNDTYFLVWDSFSKKQSEFYQGEWEPNRIKDSKLLDYSSIRSGPIKFRVPEHEKQLKSLWLHIVDIDYEKRNIVFDLTFNKQHPKSIHTNRKYFSVRHCLKRKFRQ